jgi:hypothetical protein
MVGIGHCASSGYLAEASTFLNVDDVVICMDLCTSVANCAYLSYSAHFDMTCALYASCGPATPPMLDVAEWYITYAVTNGMGGGTGDGRQPGSDSEDGDDGDADDGDGDGAEVGSGLTKVKGGEKGDGQGGGLDDRKNTASSSGNGSLWVVAVLVLAVVLLAVVVLACCCCRYRAQQHTRTLRSLNTTATGMNMLGGAPAVGSSSTAHARGLGDGHYTEPSAGQPAIYMAQKARAAAVGSTIVNPHMRIILHNTRGDGGHGGGGQNMFAESFARQPPTYMAQSQSDGSSKATAATLSQNTDPAVYAVPWDPGGDGGSSGTDGGGAVYEEPSVDQPAIYIAQKLACSGDGHAVYEEPSADQPAIYIAQQLACSGGATYEARGGGESAAGQQLPDEHPRTLFSERASQPRQQQHANFDHAAADDGAHSDSPHDETEL